MLSHDAHLVLASPIAGGSLPVMSPVPLQARVLVVEDSFT